MQGMLEFLSFLIVVLGICTRLHSFVIKTRSEEIRLEIAEIELLDKKMLIFDKIHERKKIGSLTEIEVIALKKKYLN